MAGGSLLTKLRTVFTQARAAELVAAIRLLAETTDRVTETAGGALGATIALAEQGTLLPDDEVVVCLSGHGLETVEAVQDTVLDAPTIAPRLRDVAAHVGGTRAIEIDGATVGGALDQLVTRYPQLAPRLRDAHGAPYPFVTFYLNDEDVRLVGGSDTTVADGDDVTIVPAVAGG
ncbi:MAG: MoaD/ThiS family protein [Gemmatimonadetes bacterium]|nr:MoaD/ThiS family protein [Gemmatimonadota bacterium]